MFLTVGEELICAKYMNIGGKNKCKECPLYFCDGECYATIDGRGLDLKRFNDVPEDVAPVRHEEDGTLWVTVGDCEKVGRVIVKNEQRHFCRVFYMCDGDEEPVRRGKWEDEFKEDAEAFMKHRYVCTVCGEWQTYGKTQYCPNCGAKMDMEEANE